MKRVVVYGADGSEKEEVIVELNEDTARLFDDLEDAIIRIWDYEALASDTSLMRQLDAFVAKTKGAAKMDPRTAGHGFGTGLGVSHSSSASAAAGPRSTAAVATPMSPTVSAPK